MIYKLMKLLSWLACQFSLQACLGFGDLLGKATWAAVPGKRKRMAHENIRRCLGVDDAEADRIAKTSWVQFGPMIMEILYYPRLTKEGRMKEHVSIEGLEHIQKVIAEGKGGVIATSHSDSWEIMGAALAQYGVPVVGVAKKQRDSAIDQFINEYREMTGMHITYTTGVREMFRMIKDGWMIGLITDQDPDLRDGIILDFFGRRTNCFTGPATIARSQGAPIFHGQIVHRPDGGHHITIYPPIYVEKTKDKKKDIEKATQQIASLLEKHIRKYPEDWFWMHDRWKSMREIGLD